MSPQVRRLVLAKKFSAARRLAQILSQGKTETVRAEGFSYFQFSRDGNVCIIFPLRGHVVEIDYPAEVRDWNDTDLDLLIDTEPIRQESPPALHDTLRRLSDETDEVVLATDYDREGELIGVEALETLRSRRPDLPARRARPLGRRDAAVRGDVGGRPVRGFGSGPSRHRPLEPRRRDRDRGANHAKRTSRGSARAVQHDVPPREGLPRGHQRLPSHARGSGPVCPWRDQLSANGQHSLSTLSSRP